MKKTNVAINRHRKLYGLPIKMRDSNALITHDSMPWVKSNFSRFHNDDIKSSRFHNDDIKSLILKVKTKTQDLINEFMELPKGRKIALSLSKLAKYISAAYSIKNAIELKKAYDKIKNWKEIELSTINDTVEKLKYRSKVYPNQEKISETWYANRIAESNDFEQRSKKYARALYGIKILKGLLGILISSLAEKLSKELKKDAKKSKSCLGYLNGIL